MGRKIYMINSNHDVIKGETVKENLTLQVYNEPGYKSKTLKKGDTVYVAYSFAADVEMEKEVEEDVFYDITKKIEVEIMYKGDKAYDENYLISMFKQEYGYNIKNIEFVYFLKRYYIYDYETEYSGDEIDLVKTKSCENESGV